MITKVLQRCWAGAIRATTPRLVDYRDELMLFDFTKEETAKSWDCLSDTDVEGLSRATFKPNGKGSGAIFQGELTTELRPESLAKYGGYCAIRSRPKKPGWFQKEVTDVSEYNALELRVRGDGRRFFVNLQSTNLTTTVDVWQYFLFTRGGPEWENIRLPFDEFILTHRGYLQEKQMTFACQNLTTVGLLLADKVNGPFRLEIQHIKAVLCIRQKEVECMP